MDPGYRVSLLRQGIELPEWDPNDDDYEEEEEETEEEEEEDDEEEDNADGSDGDGRDETALSQEVVNVDGPASENADDVSHVTVEDKRESRDNNDSKGGGTASLKGDDDGENGELNRGELDGLFCPICFEAWSSGGDHHVCCLPCGHIYGLSCIKKWLHNRGSNKCPQCKKKCGIKDIRLLYASRIVAVDGELQKTVQSLEAKCASLEKQGADWSKKEAEYKKKEVDLRKQVRYLKEGFQQGRPDIPESSHQGEEHGGHDHQDKLYALEESMRQHKDDFRHYQDDFRQYRDDFWHYQEEFRAFQTEQEQRYQAQEQRELEMLQTMHQIQM